MREWVGRVYLWLGVVIATMTLSCSTGNKKEEGKYQFFYYPKVNMYYDVTGSQYIYSLDSARTWNTIDEASDTPPETLGDEAILYSDTKEIWNQNEEHRQQYNGNIFNITSNATALQTAEEQGAEVKERKAEKKSTANASASKTKEKTKVGKFIQKIFGKKKKKE